MTGKTLIVMRHAKSSWKTQEPDFRRPLSGRGTRDAVVAGDILSGYDIDLVLCSAATRAQQTWQCATMGGAKATEVTVTEAIYHAWASGVLAELGTVADAVNTAMVIGHEPTLSELVLTLAAPSTLTEQVETKFPTAAIAVLTFEGPWSELSRQMATLSRLEIPRG